MVNVEMAGFFESLGQLAPTIRCMVRRGCVRKVISREVRRLNADLLVVGTRGHGRLARVLLGSVAEDLVRNPPCDILVVNPSATGSSAPSFISARNDSSAEKHGLIVAN
jgi:hypothetical protein